MLTKFNFTPEEINALTNQWYVYLPKDNMLKGHGGFH